MFAHVFILVGGRWRPCALACLCEVVLRLRRLASADFFTMIHSGEDLCVEVFIFIACTSSCSSG